MNLRMWAAGLALVTAAGTAATAFAQTKPDVLVKQRQAAMTLMGKYVGPIGAMIKGSAPYNADIVAVNATYLEHLSHMPWDGFQPSTSDVKSAAKPEIYQEDAKFKAAADMLQSATAKLGAVARARNEAGVKAAFGEVGKACGGCHDHFRVKR